MKQTLKTAAIYAAATFIVGVALFGYINFFQSLAAADETSPAPAVTIAPISTLAAQPATAPVPATAPIEVAAEDEPTYTDEELETLAALIYIEAGCSWIDAEVQKMFGSVILNRVADSRFPDSIIDVANQPGQYPYWLIDSAEPSEQVYEAAKWLLANGSMLPGDVVFQAEFAQGAGVYATYYDRYLGSTTYFCY